MNNAIDLYTQSGLNKKSRDIIKKMEKLVSAYKTAKGSYPPPDNSIRESAFRSCQCRLDTKEATERKNRIFLVGLSRDSGGLI